MVASVNRSTELKVIPLSNVGPRMRCKLEAISDRTRELVPSTSRLRKNAGPFKRIVNPLKRWGIKFGLYILRKESQTVCVVATRAKQLA